MSENKLESIIFGLKETLAEKDKEIERLQGEKAELKEDNERWEAVFKISEERKYRKMFNEEWKKEYQKELDKQGEGLIAGSPDFDYVYQRYFEQKAEIERLTREKTESAKTAVEVIEQNLELQKQVDELKAKNSHLDSENTRLLCEMDKMLDEGWDIMDEEADGWYKKGCKDTAKDIFSFIVNQYDGEYFLHNVEQFINEKYGVEVE